VDNNSNCARTVVHSISGLRAHRDSAKTFAMSRKLKNTDLKDALAAAEAELFGLLKRVETLREWILVTKKLRAKNTTAESDGHDSGPIVRSRRTKTGALLEAIVEIIGTSGGPMHVDDIVQKLQEKSYPLVAKNPKAATAVALSRRPDMFRKTAPNTFGVVEKSEKIAG